MEDKPRDKTLLLEVHDTSKMFKDYIRRSGDKEGINSTYHRIMRTIEHMGVVSQNDLVNCTGLKAPTISLMLKNMEYDGLIEKTSDPNDARSVQIRFTEKGKEQSKKNIEFIRSLEEDVESIISEEERKVVIEVLKKLQDEIKTRNENI